MVPGGTAYCASKAGLNAFSEVLNQEVRQDNIRVSYLCPDRWRPDSPVATSRRGPTGRSLPDDIAALVIALLRIDTRTLASRIEVRPAKPPKK